MKRPRILNCEPEGYSREALRILQAFADVDEIACDRRQLIDRIGAYHGLIVRLGHKIDRQILENAVKLKVIATATTGLNHIDTEEVAKRNIRVLSLRGETAFLESIHATAEHTWALLLALVRPLPGAIDSVKQGEWDRSRFKGRELSGKTLGIIGLGRLGSAVARYGLAFGMQVLACDIKKHEKQIEGVKMVDMKTLLMNADIISIHVNYNSETHGLISADALAAMKKDVLLINTSRGEIIDEAALLEALSTRHLGGAALDVLSGENCGVTPWMKSDRLIAYSAQYNNLLITPHIGGCTFESMEKTEVFIAQRIRNSWLDTHGSSHNDNCAS